MGGTERNTFQVWSFFIFMLDGVRARYSRRGVKTESMYWEQLRSSHPWSRGGPSSLEPQCVLFLLASEPCRFRPSFVLALALAATSRIICLPSAHMRLGCPSSVWTDWALSHGKPLGPVAPWSGGSSLPPVSISPPRFSRIEPGL